MTDRFGYDPFDLLPPSEPEESAEVEQRREYEAAVDESHERIDVGGGWTLKIPWGWPW